MFTIFSPTVIRSAIISTEKILRTYGTPANGRKPGPKGQIVSLHEVNRIRGARTRILNLNYERRIGDQEGMLVAISKCIQIRIRRIKAATLYAIIFNAVVVLRKSAPYMLPDREITARADNVIRRSAIGFVARNNYHALDRPCDPKTPPGEV